MEDHAVMRSHYCPAAVLELLHILHHPAREALHESILPNYISHRINRLLQILEFV